MTDSDHRREGTAILEVLRQTWGRLIHKQWLIVYPLALGVINIVAFLAVYAATGRTPGWSPFFKANLDRWQFIQDGLVSGLAWSPALAVTVIVGLCVCALAAMLRAPCFRAIIRPGYPPAPRNGREARRLSLFYALSYAATWVLPFAGSAGSAVTQIVSFVVLVIAIIIIFADYVIVLEDMPLLKALRRSFHLVIRRWLPVAIVFVILQLVYGGLHSLYAFYYQTSDGIPIVLPAVQILLDAFVILLVDILLISLYEQTPRSDQV